MAKKNTVVIRVDSELAKIINKIIGKKLMQNKKIKIPRLTKAIAKQYKKYPFLLEELERI